MIKEPLISIIIPMYNSEMSIYDCIDSVVSQGYRHLEIIVVNDGSDDDSLQIVNQFAANDSRIIIINKAKNEGLVLARKSGLEVAHGKYIQYLDSDDTLCPNAIEALVNKAEETNAQIVASPFAFCSDGKKIEAEVTDFIEVSGIDFLKMILTSKAFWSVWSKFHLRSLYNLADIERPNITLGEDIILSTQLLIRASKVVSLNKIVVNYNFTSTSMSHPASFNDKKYDDFKQYTLWIENYLTKNGLINEFTKELAFFHLKNTFMQLYWKRFKDANREMERSINDLKKYPNFINELSRREQKIIKVYMISKWLGYFNVLRYKLQGKL